MNKMDFVIIGGLILWVWINMRCDALRNRIEKLENER